MTNTYKILTWASALLVVVALIAVGNINKQIRVVSDRPLGGSLEILQTKFANGFIVGENGTAINEMRSTTCNLATTQLPLEATSTDDFTCSISGVDSGDQVFVSLPSNNGAVFGGFLVDSAVAGPGTITVGVTNLTGASTSTFPAATTSVQVLYFDN